MVGVHGGGVVRCAERGEAAEQGRPSGRPARERDGVAARRHALGRRRISFFNTAHKYLGAMPVPDSVRSSWSSVTGLLVGRDSLLWLELETGAKSEHRWRVLKRDGTIDFDLSVPGNITIMAAERGRAWAVESDPDGVQGVVRYRIVRQ